MQFRFAMEHGRTFHFHRVYLETIEGVLELLKTRGYEVLHLHDDENEYGSLEELRAHGVESSRQITIVARSESKDSNDLIELHYRNGDLLATRSDREGKSDEAWNALISFLGERHRTAEDPFLHGYIVLILGLLGALPFLAMSLYDIINWNLFVGLTILGVMSMIGALYILSIRPRQALIIYRYRHDLSFFERYGKMILGAVFAGFISLLILWTIEALVK